MWTQKRQDLMDSLQDQTQAKIKWIEDYRMVCSHPSQEKKVERVTQEAENIQRRIDDLARHDPKWAQA